MKNIYELILEFDGSFNMRDLEILSIEHNLDYKDIIETIDKLVKYNKITCLGLVDGLLTFSCCRNIDNSRR